jgi:hypothetical protein
MPGKGLNKITIRPGFSRLLAFYLLSLHGLAVWLVVLLPLQGVLRILLAAFTLYSLFYFWRRHLWQQGGRAVTGVEWSGEGEWILWDAQEKTTAATLSGSSYINPRLLILNFKTTDGKRCSLCLTADRVDKEQLRRLRAGLYRLRSSYSGGQ